MKVFSRVVSFVLRWVLGIGLMVFLLIKWDPTQVLDVLRDISPLYLALLLGLSVVLISVSCVKWSLFLAEKGSRVPMRDLMALYTLGYFFSHFMPSQYGGDLVRSYELGRDIDSHVTSFSSVFMERYTGLIGMMIISGVAALFMPDLITRAGVGLPFALAWLAFVVSLWILLDPRPVRFLAGFFSSGFFSKPVGHLESLYGAIHTSGRNPGLVARALLLSLFFHFLTVVNVYLAVLTLRGRIDFIPLMLVVPLILLVSMIPLTVNSIGLFEGAFVYFLTPLGLTGAEAMSIALLLRAKNILVAILGGFIHLSRSRRRT